MHIYRNPQAAYYVYYWSNTRFFPVDSGSPVCRNVEGIGRWLGSHVRMLLCGYSREKLSVGVQVWGETPLSSPNSTFRDLIKSVDNVK